MSTLRVGVLRGGPSSEYDVSLQTGATILRSLANPAYTPRDIFIDRQGSWHLGGLPVLPEQAAEEVDIFFNCLHGEYGEDGQIQRLLVSLDKPFTGPEEIPAIAALNKVMTKKLLARAGIKVPISVTVLGHKNYRESAKEAFSQMAPPWIVKPVDRGSSVGLSVAKTFDQLIEGIKMASDFSDQILVEQFIKGKEATVGVIDQFRDKERYTLFPVERCAGNHLCPGTFTDKEKGELSELAEIAHDTLGLRHYSNADFIISPRGIYLLEVNALPGLATHSVLPRALSALGVGERDFASHILNLATESSR